MLRLGLGEWASAPHNRRSVRGPEAYRGRIRSVQKRKNSIEKHLSCEARASRLSLRESENKGHECPAVDIPATKEEPFTLRGTIDTKTSTSRNLGKTRAGVSSSATNKI